LRIDVLNKDYVFHIKKAGAKLGKLKVSKGAIVFVPAYGGKKKQWTLSWDQVARMATTGGTKVSKLRNQSVHAMRTNWQGPSWTSLQMKPQNPPRNPQRTLMPWLWGDWGD
jgi:hypothetical protein